MPVELKFDTDTGSWLARREINLPAIYAHASTSWKVDDPVTIFWGGRTSAELASSFFVGSVSKVVGGDPFLNIKKKDHRLPVYFKRLLSQTRVRS